MARTLVGRGHSIGKGQSPKSQQISGSISKGKAGGLLKREDWPVKHVPKKTGKRTLNRIVPLK